MEDHEFLTVQEVAARLSVSPAAVYLAIRHDRLPAERRFGRLIVRAGDLAGWRPVRGRGRRKEPGSK